MQTAIVYARYSDENQRDESIEAQLYDIHRYAEKNNITVIREYLDQAESAKTDDRPKFQEMLTDVRMKTLKPTFLLLHKVDRFARNRYDAAIHKRTLRLNGVSIVYVSQNIPDSPEGRMMEGMLESVAEYYSENLAFETMKGLKVNARNCMHTGGIPPLGYDLKDKRLVLNEEEASWVRGIFERYVEGVSYTRILDWLHSINARTKFGVQFGKNSIYGIVSNEKYTGTFVFNRAAGTKGCNRHKEKSPDEIIKVPNGIPRIISDELWLAAKERLVSKRFRNGRNKAKRSYLLTGLIFCGECGSAMGGCSRYNPDGYEYSDYRCLVSHRKHLCKAKGVNCPKLENAIIEQLQVRLFAQDRIDYLADQMMQQLATGNDGLKKAIEETNIRLTGVERKIRKMVDLLMDGFRSDTIKADLEKLEQEKVQLQQKKAQQIKEMEAPTVAREDVVFYLKRFRAMDRFTAEEKRKTLQQFVERITVAPEAITVSLVVNTTGRGDPYKEIFTLPRRLPDAGHSLRPESGLFERF